MLTKEREQAILRILKDSNGFVTVAQLCRVLYVSESSVRRDLKTLERQGLVKHIYGGAQLVGGFSGIITFDHRTRQNVAAKRAIARKAAALVQDGNIVFLDQSSTAFYLAEELVNRGSLTVVTNNAEILLLLSRGSAGAISSGGRLSNENRNCLLGGDACRTFENIHADIMFFSAHSLSREGVISDCDREEILVRNAMLENAGKKVFLCDSTKFGTCSPYRQCSLQDVDVLISETAPDERIDLTGTDIQVL
ncbi:MAG: DeoR/GlpR transcriptional regulator [Oscillospiraceae bacterium]|nr:DeoR/GlpR transcriptional regulator [Oscillospiraceae bacterium]